MTDDELLYAGNEALSQVLEYRDQLLARHRGKIVKAYGAKTFQVDNVEVVHDSFWLQGFVLKKNGTCGARRYGMQVEHAEFVAP